MTSREITITVSATDVGVALYQRLLDEYRDRQADVGLDDITADAIVAAVDAMSDDDLWAEVRSYVASVVDGRICDALDFATDGLNATIAAVEARLGGEHA